jgi:glycosyltransferase involved in cell wall biosynthesis
MPNPVDRNSRLNVDLVVIHPTTEFGGAERHSVELITELHKRGLRILLIECGQPIISSRLDLPLDSVFLISTELSISSKDNSDINSWKELLDKVESERVLIVKPGYHIGSTEFYVLLKSHFKKLISIEHTPPPARHKWSSQIHFDRRIRTGFWWYSQHFNLKKRSRTFDRTITVSHFNKSCLIEDALVPKKRIIVCQNGINPNIWKMDKEKAQEFRKKLNIPDDSFLFGCIGRLAPEKGYELAIDAFKNFQERGDTSNCYLILIGEGRMRGELEQRAASAQGKIIFLGFMNDLVPAYSAINVVLFTSHYKKFWSGESFGLTLAEAMSCECCIIAINMGATPEIIGECADACELIKTRDTNAWSAAMKKYSVTPREILAERGTRLRQRVLEHYDASSTYPHLIDVLMSA